MKSRQRPPLNLTDPEPEERLGESAASPEPGPAEAEATAPEVSERTEPPMSERRRRRMMEEQRLAEQRAALEIVPPPPVDSMEQVEGPTQIEFAKSAEAPPAPYVPPVAPAVTATVPTATGSDPLDNLKAAEVTGAARHVYAFAGLGSVLWAGGVAALAAYEIGAAGSVIDPLRIAIYGLLALAPVGLAILLAHAVRQGAGLAAETRRARGLAQALVAPTALAAQQTGQVLQTLRQDIDQASLAADKARKDMTLLREALAEETSRLNEAASTANQTARKLSEALGREREEMLSLGVHLNTQSETVLNSVERQSRMIVDASDLAQTQLREAEAALAARAADLAAAAVEAQDAARLASDDLARQTLRLENAGSGVTEQIQSVEEGLGQQRAALVSAAYALRTEQEDFSAQVESQRAQLIAQLDLTRTVTGTLDETASRSAESIRDLVEAATDQFRALVDMSQREADGFDAATRVALDRFEALAAEARDTLVEETRRSLATMQATAEQARLESIDAAHQAQLRADRLGEAVFNAAQKADQAAEDRIADARRIVSQTADLVDAAGESAVERLQRTMDRMTRALAEIETAVVEMDERAARMPEEARLRAGEVQATVENGLVALAAASRKAAEETEALDAAFQERVRRNYDMLTDAVRLMGVVSGENGTTRRSEPEAKPAGEEDRPVRRPRSPEPIETGLRGRVRPEPAEDEFSIRPTPPAPRSSAAAAGPMGWNDFVSDETASRPAPQARSSREPSPSPAPAPAHSPSPSPAEAEALAERITAAIRRMGVDPNALLPRSRVEEAAGAFASRDPERARQIVRRIAPAAVRSVSRRVLGDPELRADCELYVRTFARMLESHGRDASAILGQLGTDSGRSFLLLDAAVGDLS